MRNHHNVKLPTSRAGHAKHVLMMAACCGAPIVLLAAIGLYGISSQSLETMILLLCPLGMGIMMWMMMKDKGTLKSAEDKEVESKTESAQISKYISE